MRQIMSDHDVSDNDHDLTHLHHKPNIDYRDYDDLTHHYHKHNDHDYDNCR